LVGIQLREIIEGERHIGMILAQGILHESKCTLKERFRLLVFSLTAVQARKIRHAAYDSKLSQGKCPSVKGLGSSVLALGLVGAR
jgi:hypothetical protein